MNNTPIPINIQGHPASVDAYIRHGWKLVPIPSGTKGPSTREWNQPGHQVEQANQLPPNTGIGLAHAYSGTMALDVDDWTRASEELAKCGIDLDQLYNAPDTVTIESGRPGRSKLLYTMPFGLTLPSKKLIENNKNYLDFRCSTKNGLTVQDVLPPTIHPDTGKSYSWGGRGHWIRPPLIPPELLIFWQKLITQSTDKKVPTEGLDASWAEIEEALAHIPSDIDRENWIAIGMALHWAGNETDQLDEAFALWDEWSAGTVEYGLSAKYIGTDDLLTSWVGFTSESGRTLGTLFHLAKEGGWRRAVPDAAQLFEGVEQTVPQAVGLMDILDGAETPPPDLDLALWPEILATRAEEISESVGCDPIVPLFASIGALCGAVNAQTRLKLVEGFEVPPVLWLMTIGKPADKKTPGSKSVFKSLFKIEAEDRPKHHQDMMMWEAQELQYKGARENFLAHYQETETLMSNDVPPGIPDLPAAPVPLKLVVQDITSQKLIRNCSDRPEGLLCYLDEMGAWVRKMCDKNSGEDRSSWLTSYESMQYRMERVQAGSIWCDNLAVSIYGNIQPDVFKANMDKLAEDGLIQRFIPARLRKSYTRRGKPIPPVFTSENRWEETVRIVHDLPAKAYTLSPEAGDVYSEFQDWYYIILQEETDIRADKKYMMAFGKLEGLCGRLILMFHLVDHPADARVSPETARRAVEVIKEFVVPSMRYTYGEIGGLDSDSLDTWLASHIIGICGHKETATLSELRRSARRQLEGINASHQGTLIRDSMIPLEQANWVIKTEDTYHSTKWTINPQLAETFKAHRERVIQIKQDRLDANRAIAQRAKGVPIERKRVRGYRGK